MDPAFLQDVMRGGLQGHLLVALLLFATGLAVVLVRRSVLVQFMGVELMLNAANLALIAFGRFHQGDVQGTVLYLFVIAVAACEAAVGLALVVALHRLRGTTDSDRSDALKH